MQPHEWFAVAVAGVISAAYGIVAVRARARAQQRLLLRLLLSEER